jgi:hypothetical protein
MRNKLDAIPVWNDCRNSVNLSSYEAALLTRNEEMKLEQITERIYTKEQLLMRAEIIAQIRDIKKVYEQTIKPYIDELVRIENMAELRIYFMPSNEE